MADKMVFPIGFDLEGGIKEAEKQAKDMQERIKRAVGSEPVKVDIKADNEAAINSISAINSAMKDLVKEWNNMPLEAKFDKDGGISADAEKIVVKYKQLSAALEGYGRTLEKVIALDKKNTDGKLKGIYSGFEDGRPTAALEKSLEKLKKIDEQIAKIDAKFARLNAANANIKTDERVVALLEKRIELEDKKSKILLTAETAAKNFRKEEEAEQKRLLELDKKRKNIKGIGVGLQEGAPTKGLENSIKEFDEIEKRLKEIDATYARINATGAATKADGSASERVVSLLRERNELEKRREELTRTASEASKRLTRDEEAEQKRLLALQKQRIKQEEANRKQEQRLKALYDSTDRSKQGIIANIAELKRQRAALSEQENTIAKINAKLAVYNRMLQNAAIGSEKFKRITANIQRLSDKLSDISGENRKTAAANKLTNAYKTQTTYIERLIKRMALYTSIAAIGRFAKNVREVTAQFELQRKSLGAIIQDQTRANALFSEIKQFALKSPVSIMDFTKYTKQVAAYRIETDKLFDTTKRLADVSVGLGVDMGRLVLAYGQVKAASYLRAAEIRQFTEAGIPLLELLSEKFTALQGSVVSTEEVMDKVSKRMVSFSMVEEIFKDMTDAGGMFYNMQEKQANTLYGMWAKLGDAASMMYNEIGNTSTVNKALKELIENIQFLMKHWTAFANVGQTVLVGFGLYKAAMAGLIPYYNLQNKLSINSIKAEKAKQAQQIKTIAIGRELTREEKFAIATKNKLLAEDYKQLLNEQKLSAARKLSMARQAASNVQLRRAVIDMQMFTKEQIKSIGAMSKWQFALAKMKLFVSGLGQSFVNLGRTLLSFWPVAALTVVTDLFVGWKNSLNEQKEAVEEVEKQYEEMRVTLAGIENAYRDIQNAMKSAAVSEDEFIKSSYSQKLAQLQKVIKMLENFGMKNVIDLSVINYTNIDTVLDGWIAKLNDVNELARDWGRKVAEVANAYEGNIFGWSVFGENLKEDMKDLERSWTKMTVNHKFSKGLSQLQAAVGILANENKNVYNEISNAIGADLKLALGQKRRNESELQYQQRIYKNYIAIEERMRNYITKNYFKKKEYRGLLPSFDSLAARDIVTDFQEQVKEVMHEFDKVKDEFRGKDALSVRMAIDTVAAENEWTQWQKELLIQHLNENPITLNAEIIPTTDIAGQRAVAEGMKAIITSEFPTLFNENELQSLVSADGIMEAIKTKLDASNESLSNTMKLQNNIVYGSEGFERTLERVEKLQAEISEIEGMRAELNELEAIKGKKTNKQILRQSELQAKLQEIDESIVDTKRAQIAAIVEANAKYDEQIQKQRESAEAEREIAKAALERVASMGLSSLGMDVKNQFEGLISDALKGMTDKDYSADFLISDEDLQKIKDVADLYDVWANNVEGITKAKEKLAGVGISELTIAKERAELDERQAHIQTELNDVEQQLADTKYKGQKDAYAELKLSLANATSAEEQRKAQEKLNKFLGDEKNAQFAILMLKREGLAASLQETLLSQSANEQINAYMENLNNAEDLWKKLGLRYNFKLLDKGKGSGEDPWIILMKNRMKFMQDFQKGVEDLSKWMGKVESLTNEQENMLGRGLSVQIDSRKLEGTKDELIKWYEDAIAEIRKRIAKLGGKEFEGLGVQAILAKDIKGRTLKKYQELLQEFWKNLTDFRTDKVKEDLEAKIKSLSDEISKSKAVKSFFDNIFANTKDYDLAMNVTVGVYGDTGGDLKRQIAEQIKYATSKQGGDVFVDLDMSGVIDPKTLDVNYKALREAIRKYEDLNGKLPEEQKKVLEQILKNGEDYNKAQIERWNEVLSKNRTFAQQYVDMWRETDKEIRDIRAKVARGDMSKETGDKYIQGYQQKRSEGEAKLEWDMFKDMPMYVQMFDDLDKASGRALRNMRDKLAALQGMWGSSLNPTELKELQSRLNDIDTQLATKNPFRLLSDSIREYKDARDSLQNEPAELRVQNAKANVAKIEADEKYGPDSYQAAQAREELAVEERRLAVVQNVNEKKKALWGYERLIAEAIAESENQQESARANLEAAQEEYERVRAEESTIDQTNTAEVEAWRAKLAAQDMVVNAAQKEYTIAQNTVKTFQRQANAQKKLKDNINNVFKTASKWASAADEVAGTLGDIKDLLQISSDSSAGIVFDSAVEGLQNFSKIMGVIIGLQTIYNAICESNPWLAIAAAVLAVVSFVSALIKNERVAQANKEIEKQEKIIKRLELEYDRLSEMTDKVFGGEYIVNYTKRLNNLEAQYEATMKKIEAERSKGKNADKDKIEDFEDEAYDTMKKIQDMQAEVSERMLGTDLAGAAQSFAESWLDAYLSFSDTAEAMKDKYREMMKSFIVQNVLASSVQSMLKPVYDMIDEFAQGGFTDDEIGKIADLFSQVYKGMDGSLNTLMDTLMEKIPELKELYDTGELTGISRDIATASEESINGLAVGINTQNFYISRIHANMNLLMENLNTGALKFTLADATMEALDKHLAYLPTIAQHTAETVNRCERAAVACESTLGLLSRVIKPEGSSASYRMYVS